MKDKRIVGVEYFVSEGFIEEIVNKYIKDEFENFNNLSSNGGRIHIHLNTYCANDDLVSVKVETATSIYDEDESRWNIKCFNFSRKEQKQIYLKDIFDNRYEEAVKDVYTDDYILGEKSIVFFKSSHKYNKVKYKKLSDYNASYYLTADNYGMSEEEYNKLFEE